MMRSVLILFLAAFALSAQTMKERVKPYLVRALEAGSAFVGVSAASGDPMLAPDSLGSLYGPNLAAQTAIGQAPYPTSLGGVSVLSIMTTPDKAYRWWYRDPLTKILFKGTFAKIGVKNLRWTNYASVTAKTPEQRAGILERTEQAFAAL